MATFYFNHDSGESSESQWTRHIQNQGYIEDVTKSVINSTGRLTSDFSAIISNQTKEINDITQNASREQIAAIQQSTSSICGTLESGFEMLSDDLQEISFGIGELRSELNSMASMLDWKLSLLIENQRITNLFLGNIAILLRIPDIQKERQYHIEQGIKFLKNSIFDNDFYDDSLMNLLKAEKIEPSDFFVLHRIGFIYMYSSKNLDLNKAEEYFKKAAKYAIAEINVPASVTNNFLSGDINRDLLEQTTTTDTIRLQAAESYLFAARSCYIQGKFIEAVDFARKSFNLVPQMLEAGFTQAKALAANNEEEEAAIVLEKVIENDRFYSLKTLSDLDLCPKMSIQSLLKKLQREATEEATKVLENCKSHLISGSNASDYLDKIEELVNKNTYLSSKKAIDLLNKNKNWSFCDPFKNPNQKNYLTEIIEIIKTYESIGFCKSDAGFIPMNPKFIDTLINTINCETQWVFPFYSIIDSNSNWIEVIKSNGGKYNVVQYLKLEQKFYNQLPEFVIRLKQQQLENINYNESFIHLKNLYDKDKNRSFFGKSYRKEIINHLDTLCYSKEDCINLITNFRVRYNTNLLYDLEKLSTNYDNIKENLAVFIKFKMVKPNYPHEIIK